MDEAILRAINSLAAIEFFAALGIVLSSKWMVPVICAPLALVLIKQRKWSAMVSIAIALIASDSLNSRVLKPIMARERPCRTLEGLIEPVSCGVGKSFPSTHASNAFAFLVAAAPTVPHGWAIFAPISGSIALSRVLLGVHYPSDVVGGAIFGSIVGGLCWLGRKKWEARKTSHRPSTHPSATNEPASPPP